MAGGGKNHYPNLRKSRCEQQVRSILYYNSLGLTDHEIGKILGVAAQNIQHIRATYHIPCVDLEYIYRVRCAHTGKDNAMSNPEYRQKVSAGLKVYYSTHTHPCKGKTHTEESKQKMREHCKKGKDNHFYRGGMYQGKYFYLYKPKDWTGKCSIDGKHVAEHIYNYCKAHCLSDIPEGYMVHHRDFNPLNNSPDNLVLLPKKLHSKLHGIARFSNGGDRIMEIKIMNDLIKSVEVNVGRWLS